jgi:hypothetical protein
VLTRVPVRVRPGGICAAAFAVRQDSMLVAMLKSRNIKIYLGFSRIGGVIRDKVAGR